MKFGLGLYGPILTQDNFRFTRRAGATHIVAHIVGWSRQPVPDANKFPGYRISPPDDPIWTYAGMLELKKAINSRGLELEAIENFEPAHWYDVLLDGPRRAERWALNRIIRNMGKAGIPVMGYNFSYRGVGTPRTTVSRGGASGAGFHDPDQPLIPRHGVEHVTTTRRSIPRAKTASWRRSRDRSGSALHSSCRSCCLWPRKPASNGAASRRPAHAHVARPAAISLPALYLRPRAGYSPQPDNALEFCLGTLSEMTEGDIYDVVDKYTRANKVAYIHFRNVRGKVPHYDEVFVDEGDTDMIRVIRILHRNRYDGVLIPDHTPAMSCAAPWHAGMAYALGYMRAAARIIEAE